MTTQEKYAIYRKVAKDGDILLFRGNSIPAKGIQYFDNAYYNHSAIVYWNRGRLEILDAWYGGIVKVPASKRIRDYENGDFCVIRLQANVVDISKGIDVLNNRWQAEVKYHYAMLFRIALIKKTGIDITGISKRNRVICSFATREYTDAVGINCYKNLHLITPEDFKRYMDPSEARLLFYKNI